MFSSREKLKLTSYFTRGNFDTSELGSLLEADGGEMVILKLESNIGMNSVKSEIESIILFD